MEEETTICSICLGTVKCAAFPGSCVHKFCFNCINQWSKVNPKCPVCNASFENILYNIKSVLEFDNLKLFEDTQAHHRPGNTEINEEGTSANIGDSSLEPPDFSGTDPVDYSSDNSSDTDSSIIFIGEIPSCSFEEPFETIIIDSSSNESDGLKDPSSSGENLMESSKNFNNTPVRKQSLKSVRTRPNSCNERHNNRNLACSSASSISEQTNKAISHNNLAMERNGKFNLRSSSKVHTSTRMKPSQKRSGKINTKAKKSKRK